jgi:transcriptional regulator with XRE-family HTH domain
MLKDLLESQMRERGFSTRELAKEANVSHTTVFRALRGDPVDLKTLIALAEWLGVPPSTLVNSLGKSEDSLPDKIAVILDRHPSLKRSFELAVEAIEMKKVDPDIVEDIAAYAVYRIELATKKKVS